MPEQQFLLKYLLLPNTFSLHGLPTEARTQRLVTQKVVPVEDSGVREQWRLVSLGQCCQTLSKGHIKYFIQRGEMLMDFMLATEIYCSI